MLASKVTLITGSTRGIGKSIASRFAKEGSIVIITGKTTKKHKKLPNTIFTVAEEINNNGGKAFPIELDVRDEKSIYNAINLTIEKYGKLDILVNNASAINNSNTLKLDTSKFDLINQVNGRGTFLTTKHAIPHLLKSDNPHVLTLSPPLNLDPRWFKIGGVGYTMSKYMMSLFMLGSSEEFKNKIAFNSLWPKTTIATEAVRLVAGDISLKFSMKPEIMADAAFEIVIKDKKVSGNFFIDHDLVDHTKYKNTNMFPTLPDLYVGNPYWSEVLFSWMKFMNKKL